MKTPLTEEKPLTFGKGGVLGDRQTQMRERERGIDRRERSSDPEGLWILAGGWTQGQQLES